MASKSLSKADFVSVTAYASFARGKPELSATWDLDAIEVRFPHSSRRSKRLARP